jgi:hypothetical protein
MPKTLLCLTMHFPFQQGIPHNVSIRINDHGPGLISLLEGFQTGRDKMTLSSKKQLMGGFHFGVDKKCCEGGTW